MNKTVMNHYGQPGQEDATKSWDAMQVEVSDVHVTSAYVIWGLCIQQIFALFIIHIMWMIIDVELF